MNMKILMIFLISLLCCCTSIETVKETLSPDSNYKVISTIQYSGGAAGSVSYVIYLNKKGEELNDDDIILKALHTKGINIYWESKSYLIIEYHDMDLLDFKNKKYFSMDKGDYDVEIELKKKN